MGVFVNKWIIIYVLLVVYIIEDFKIGKDVLIIV